MPWILRSYLDAHEYYVNRPEHKPDDLRLTLYLVGLVCLGLFLDKLPAVVPVRILNRSWKFRLNAWAWAVVGMASLPLLAGRSGAWYLGCIFPPLAMIMAYHHGYLPYRWSIGGITFTYVLGYVTMLRFAYVCGMVILPYEINTLFLMSTLRASGLAFAVAEEKWKQIEGLPLRSYQGLGHAAGTFRLTDALHYLFFAPGLLTGPFIPFSKVYAALHHHVEPQRWETKYKTTTPYVNVGTRRYMTYRFLETLPHFAILGLGLVYLPSGYFESQQFQELSWVRKLGWTLFFACMGRSRYIAAWLVSEMQVILAGVGRSYVTEGSKKVMVLDPTWVITANPIMVELAPSFHILLRNWNCSVQRFWAFYIYSRLPIKDAAIRRYLVFIISGLWHGIELGFLIGFTGGFCLEELQRICGFPCVLPAPYAAVTSADSPSPLVATAGAPSAPVEASLSSSPRAALPADPPDDTDKATAPSEGDLGALAGAESTPSPANLGASIAPQSPEDSKPSAVSDAAPSAQGLGNKAGSEQVELGRRLQSLSMSEFAVDPKTRRFIGYGWWAGAVVVCQLTVATLEVYHLWMRHPMKAFRLVWGQLAYASIWRWLLPPAWGILYMAAQKWQAYRA